MKLSDKRRAASLILKLIVFVSATVGVCLSAFAGFTAFMGGSVVFMYFTIQSNIAVALICAIGALLMFGKKPVKNGWFILKFVGTVAITLTGLVFTFMLAPTLGDKAWNPQNVLTHVVVPIAAIADFFVTGICSDIKKKHLPLVILPELAYVIYATVGYFAGWEFSPGANYPYFFFNWAGPAGAFGFINKFPFMGCAWWMALLVALVFAMGAVYMLILNKMKKAKSGRENTKP